MLRQLSIGPPCSPAPSAVRYVLYSPAQGKSKPHKLASALLRSRFSSKDLTDLGVSLMISCDYRESLSSLYALTFILRPRS